MTYSYACADYPGMDECPGRFEAAAEVELWKHIELHAAVAHDEDPAQWTSEDRTQVEALISATT